MIENDDKYIHLHYEDEILKDIEITIENNLNTKHNETNTLTILNVNKTYIRWFNEAQESFYDKYLSKLSQYSQYNELIKNITINKNAISLLYNHSDLLNLIYLPLNINGICLLNMYLKNDEGNYTMEKINMYKLNIPEFWKNVFSNNDALELILFYFYIYKNHTDRTYINEILPYFASNKKSIEYFTDNINNINEDIYQHVFLKFAENKNPEILNVIKMFVKNFNKKHNNSIFNLTDDNGITSIKNNYLINHQFIVTIIHDYDIYKLYVLNKDWNFICMNRHCDNIILNRHKEDEFIIDLVDFITNPIFSYEIYNDKLKIIFDSELIDILDNDENIIKILLNLNENIIKFLLNLNENVIAKILKIIPFRIINFVLTSNYTDEFKEYIIKNPIILRNPFLDENILILLNSGIAYYRYTNVMKNLSKNPSILIISKLFSDSKQYINWSEMSKQTAAINYLFTSENINYIVMESLCENCSEQAIKLIYLKILDPNINNKLLLDELYLYTIKDIENQIENIDITKINNPRLIWIKWEYLSSNPLAIILLNKFKDKIIWKNVVQNKSEHPMLYSILMHGYDIPKLFDEEIWNNLLANDNPIMIDFIIRKVKYQTMTVSNWSHLSKNSNPEIINLFNNNLKYRFKIDWKEMSGNKNINKLDAFDTKINKITILKDFVKSLIYNDSIQLTNINTINIALKQELEYWNDSALPYNKNLDNILENYKVFDNEKIFRNKEIEVHNFNKFIIELMSQVDFYKKVLTNQYALKTINKYKYLHSNIHSNFTKFIPILVGNPLFFCSHQV